MSRLGNVPVHFGQVPSVLPCADCLVSLQMCRGLLSPHAKDAWAADVHSSGIPHVGQDHGLWRRHQPVGEQSHDVLLGAHVAFVSNLMAPQAMSVQGILADACQC